MQQRNYSSDWIVFIMSGSAEMQTVASKTQILLKSFRMPLNGRPALSKLEEHLPPCE